MSKSNKTTTELDAFDALHSFVVESNLLLGMLHGIARLPARKCPAALREKLNATSFRHWESLNPDLRGNVVSEGDGVVGYIASWFKLLDAAYAVATDDEIRVALADLAGSLPKVADEQFIFRMVRNSSGLFLRRFESKQFAVERALAVLAVKVNRGGKTPSLNLIGEHETVAAAMKYIEDHPGQKSLTVSNAVGISDGHFRSRIVPRLKALGVTNPKKRGYFPPG